jgi:probable phosphoglycerate mutase
MPSLFPEPSQPRVPSTRLNSQKWLIAHCDGGARGNPGPAGYGAVLQTEDGETLAELSEFLGIRTNNYAEYSGLLGVLAWALEHGHRRLRVVSDSELMVKQIQGRYKVNSPDLKPLWTEARNRIAKLDEFQITHALRHKNKDADRLANVAMDRGMGRSSDEPKRELNATPYPKQIASTSPMLRGFTRDGVVHLLGDAKLPDGIFVKIVPE